MAPFPKCFIMYRFQVEYTLGFHSLGVENIVLISSGQQENFLQGFKNVGSSVDRCLLIIKDRKLYNMSLTSKTLKGGTIL